MLNMLWAERQKIRRLPMIWITVFATVMAAVIVFALGREIYYGPEAVYYGSRYIDHAGWYMNVAQSLATFFLLPSVAALFGSYLICREEQEDTLKALRLIPINEAKLTAAKMTITCVLCIFLYLLLFVITLSAELILHASGLSAAMILGFLKEYVLDGLGVFLAIAPIIAFVSRWKKGYWLALIGTQIYAFAGLLAGMSSTLTTFYPITAVFNLSGHHIVSEERIGGSMAVLLLCGCLAAFILKRVKYKKP